MGGPCDQPHVHSNSYLRGALLVESGDWIVADPDGIHFDIVKPEAFEEIFIEVHNIIYDVNRKILKNEESKR